MSSVYYPNQRRRDPDVDNFSNASIAESETKTHTDSTSPYSKIFRKSNIYSAMIPNFLKQQEPTRGITIEDLRRLEIQSLPKFDINLFEINPEKLQMKCVGILEEIRQTYFLPETLPSDREKMQSLLNDIMRRAYHHIHIHIKKYDISGEELFKLLNNRDINVKIVNSFMQHLKQYNRFLIKKSKTIKKFNFLCVELSELILIRGGLIKIQNFNVSAYEFHVFSVFHHYWKLVVFCTSDASLKVYDLGKNLNDCVMYKENLENFLKFNQQNPGEIRIEDIPRKGINLWNSGLFMCKMAQNLLNGNDGAIGAEEIYEFRVEIIIVLLRLSQINFART